MSMKPTATHPGAAMEPLGDPMKAGVGAGAWADRDDRCDLTVHGDPRIQPISVLEGYHVESRDPDPRGMTVVAGDGARVGSCVDFWVDRAEPQIRYLTVALDDGAHKLIPMGFVKVRAGKGELHVRSIFGKHFADVPSPRAQDRITLLEEDKLVAWYAGGYRYADPSRNEPIF